MSKGSRIVQGSLYIFLAQASIVPTGLITVAFLTVELGAAGYGLYTLAVTTVLWIEWSINDLFSKTVVKFISEVDDWQPIGTLVLQLYTGTGFVAAIALYALSPAIARSLQEPSLTPYLQLFAWDLPIFCAVQAHHQILIGTGRFARQAVVGLSRWIARLLLIVGFVSAGFSVQGAIFGCLATSYAELGLCRYFVRPALRGSAVHLPQLWQYALPLVIQALLLRGYQQIDLYLLKTFGGDLVQIGLYGATKNLSLIVLIAGTSVAAVLLSGLNRIIAAKNFALAKTAVQNAMRFCICLLPTVGLCAGVAHELAGLLFGDAFLATAALIGPTIVGSVALVMVLVSTSILVASHKPSWTALLIFPMLATTVISHALLVPRYGALGSAVSMAISATIGAILASCCVYQVWRLPPPVATLIRSCTVGALAYGMTAIWPTVGMWVLVKLAIASVLSAIAFILLGEISRKEIISLSPPYLARFLR